MSGIVLSRDTVYKQYVNSNVPKVCDGVGVMYTIEEVAERVGLKPTHNFRRRVKEMVEAGLLQAVPAFSPKGGLINLYTTPSCEPTEEPF